MGSVEDLAVEEEKSSTWIKKHKLQNGCLLNGRRPCESLIST